MTDADLQLDADDRDWFHVSPAEYDRQRSPAIRRTPRRWGS
jgi:hypothetical protein